MPVNLLICWGFNPIF